MGITTYKGQETQLPTPSENEGVIFYLYLFF